MDPHETLKQDKYLEEIYFYLLKNGPTSPSTLREKIKPMQKRAKKISWKVLDEKLRKGCELGLWTEKSIWIKGRGNKGDRKLYYLKNKNLIHLLFFDEIRKRNEYSPTLYGDGGDLPVEGLFTKMFQNNFTIFGFPERINPETGENNLNEYETEMLVGILKQFDNAFEQLKKIKLIYLLRKKIDNEKWLSKYNFPYGVISEKLLLENLIFYFSKALYDLVEQDSSSKKSFNFLLDLKDNVNKSAKKNNITLSSGAYPEKMFTHHSNFFYLLLFSSDPLLAKLFNERPNELREYFKGCFSIIQNKDWFYNSKKTVSLEKIENDIINFADKKLSKGTNIDEIPKIINAEDSSKDSPLIHYYQMQKKKSFYEKDFDSFENIAVLSSNSMIESSESKRNLDLVLTYFFNSYCLTADFKKEKDSCLKVLYMCSLIIHVRHIKIDRILIEEFKQHEKINEFFTPGEIELMVSIINDHNWKDRDECEYNLWIKLYDKNGPWEDKWFTVFAEEFIQHLNRGESYETRLGEYGEKLQIKNKPAAFEEYLNSKIYFEIEKPKKGNEKKKNKKYKYKTNKGMFCKKIW